MIKDKIYKVILGFSLVLLTTSLVLSFIGTQNLLGPFIIAFFVCLAIGFRGFDSFKKISFTMWIFVAVAASMFYPQYFISVGNFKFNVLIVPLLQIIMFGMGSQMSLSNFTGILKMPKGVIIGVAVQFLVMPFTALLIAKIFDFPAEIAAGIILIGSVPSGMASNVMSYIAGANVPLAITIGAMTTLLAPVMTPFLMQTLAGQYIDINFWSMMNDIMQMAILPITAGFIFNMFYNKKDTKKSMITQMISYFLIIILTGFITLIAKDSSSMLTFFLSIAKLTLLFYIFPVVLAMSLKRILKGGRAVIEKILSSFSSIGIVLIITIITAAGRDYLLSVGILLIFTSLLHNLTGYFLGYSSAALFKMSEQDRRTIAFECGMQNGGMASGLAMQIGKVATVGLAPAIFGPLMNITGSILASWWHSKPPKESAVQKNQTKTAHLNNEKNTHFVMFNNSCLQL